MYNSDKRSGKPGYKGKNDSAKRPFERGAKPRFKKPFKRDDDGEKKPYNKEERSFRPREDKGGFKKPFDREKRSYKSREDKEGERRPFKRNTEKSEGDKESKVSSYKKKRSFTRNKTIRKNFDVIGDKAHSRPNGYRDKKPFKKFDRAGDEKGFVKKERRSNDFREDDRSEKREGAFKPYGNKKPYKDKPFEKRDKKPFRKFDNDKKDAGYEKKARSFDDRDDKKPFRKSKRSFEKKENDGLSFEGKEKAPVKKQGAIGDGLIRLNKYLSNSGICSRREADDLIKAGSVKVNDKVITEMGFKVGPTDVIVYDGATLKRESKVYVLLNKPKDYITTTDDPRERHTVMELVADACKERLYPVGRLDRNTTGLLLFTNDGEMAAKLTHPKFGIKKVYNVVLNRNLRTEDFKKLIDGVELEDGPARPDDMQFIDGNKNEIGLEIHSGKNRIVRRMFEHLGYEVVKLDRTRFAGLTKKDLQRGKWRFLSPKEISYLKMIG